MNQSELFSSMEGSSFSDDLRRYTTLLWSRLWLLLLVTILAAGTAYIVSKQITPIYQAQTTILINEAPANRTTDYSAIVASERQAQTYAQLLSKQPVLEGTIERLGLDMEVNELRELIQVEPLRDTTLIEVRVEHPDPVLAAEIANALVLEFSDQAQELQASRYAASKENLSQQLTELDNQIQRTNETLENLGDSEAAQNQRDRLETNLAQYRQTYAALLQSFEQVRLAEAQSTSTIIQAEPAVPPEFPVRPRTLLNTVLAGMVGLMLALGVIFLVEALDDTLKDPEQVSRALELPVLGIIARHESADGRPVTMVMPRSPVSEAFRTLRTNIQYASVDTPLHTLLVTSPSPSDGKSLVAANLAAALAQSGRKVVLLDADLRRPRVHDIMQLPNTVGVTSLFMQRDDSLDGALQEVELENLSVITSGETPPNPSELLGSERMSAILRIVQENADLVLVDSPPVMAVTDASVLAPGVDGVLLVLKPGVTRLTAARQTVEQLRHVGARILGLVFNEVDLQRSRYYGGYYYQGYYRATREYLSGPESENGRSVKRKKKTKVEKTA